ATDNALALAVATMVGIDASAIGDVGFLLSATATGGLLYLGDPISHRLAIFPGAIREGLATTLAATHPTLPIIAAAFGPVLAVTSRLVLAIRRRIRWPRPLGTLSRPRLARRAVWMSAALLTALVAGSAVAVLWPATSGIRVRALDVGQGDAYLVEFDGKTLLV